MCNMVVEPENAENEQVLQTRYSGGPHGLGDPQDKSLRKVEMEIMIPKKMREKAKIEKCIEEVAKFTECCKDSKLLMVVKCRNENTALKNCLTKWYQDAEFKRQCTEEYLKERTEYRQTGITRKEQQRIASNM